MNALKTIVASIFILWVGIANAQDIAKDEAGFTEYIAAQLRKEIGDGAVSIKEPLTISLGEIQANLDRIYNFCQRNTEACLAEVDRYVKAAVQVYRDKTAPPTKDAVRVVIRSSQYVQAVQATANGKEMSPHIQPRPFVEGLVAVPVLDSPRIIRMLSEKDNDKLGLSSQEVYELGIANLRKELKPLMDVAKIAGHAQIGQLVGDTFHPSRLLLLDTWAPLAAAQNGVLIVAIPATDALFYIGEDTPDALDALRTLSKNVMQRAPNRLSGILLRWNEAGWEVVH